MLYSEVLKSNKKVELTKVKIEVVKTTTELCDEFVESYSRSPGLKKTKDSEGYSYTLATPRMNTDPFVRKAMKIEDPSMYRNIEGYSKKPEIKLTLETLAKYSHTQARKVFNKDERAKKCWDKARNATRRKFCFSGLVPYDNTPVLNEIEKSTAAGFSWPGKKKGDVIDQIGSVAAKMRHDIQDGRFVPAPPCKLAQRGHLHDDENPKSRPVWIMPAETIVLEGKFALPYIEQLKQSKTVLIGENSMHELIKLLNPVSSTDRAYSAALDWSAFDSSVPNWLIDEAFMIVASAFDFSKCWNEKQGVHWAKRGKDIETKTRKSLEANNLLYSWLVTNFKKTKIMLPNGVIMKKMHGIPSGSYFTQVIGSICNYLITSFNMYMQGYEDFDLHVLGDDSYVRFGRPGLDLSLLAANSKKYFNMVLNVQKSSVKTFSEPQKFLGYEVEGLTLVRKDEDFAKMVLYPERDVNTLEQSISRVFAYYLLGGVNNPWYCRFYHHYLGMYQKYGIKSFSLHAGIYRTLRYVAGLDVHPYEKYDFDPTTISSLLVAYHFYFDYGIYTSDFILSKKSR